ncbi:hypothetical protein GWI33_019105 [Rhynchophorus ferrugineus]|uniref:Uncharacterized protein n=1 Tax=Rhynchophorus ferrugineus TaxID=354439 RepID=A0A834I5V9_RHYFE|nr:hypothetical protein GWI33_019105 [Rhynchophorus ferrugineus]
MDGERNGNGRAEFASRLKPATRPGSRERQEEEGVDDAAINPAYLEWNGENETSLTGGVVAFDLLLLLALNTAPSSDEIAFDRRRQQLS